MRPTDGRRLALAAAFLLLLPVSGRAQQPSTPAPQNEELAKQLSNPISSLVSVPFQFNWEQNVGPSEATRFVLNVQPVMPFTMNQDWNLIVRIIAPLVSQPALIDGGVAASASVTSQPPFSFRLQSPESSGERDPSLCCLRPANPHSGPVSGALDQRSSR